MRVLWPQQAKHHLQEVWNISILLVWLLFNNSVINQNIRVLPSMMIISLQNYCMDTCILTLTMQTKIRQYRRIWGKDWEWQTKWGDTGGGKTTGAEAKCVAIQETAENRGHGDIPSTSYFCKLIVVPLLWSNLDWAPSGYGWIIVRGQCRSW